VIRDAVRADIPALVSLARRHHEENGFPFVFNAARLSITLALAIAQPDWLCLTGNRCVLLAFSFESPLGAGKLATEFLLRAERRGDMKELVTRYEAWARGRGCVQATLGCTSKPEVFARLYRPFGYTFAETVFAKRL
jgi:GNAT superfamily N-acetyltransferase